MIIKDIELEKVKKKDPEEMKSVRMQIRTTPKISKWMKKNKVLLVWFLIRRLKR